MITMPAAERTTGQHPCNAVVELILRNLTVFIKNCEMFQFRGDDYVLYYGV